MTSVCFRSERQSEIHSWWRSQRRIPMRRHWQGFRCLSCEFFGCLIGGSFLPDLSWFRYGQWLHLIECYYNSTIEVLGLLLLLFIFITWVTYDPSGLKEIREGIFLGWLVFTDIKLSGNSAVESTFGTLYYNYLALSL